MDDRQIEFKEKVLNHLKKEIQFFGEDTSWGTDEYRDGFIKALNNAVIRIKRMRLLK